jgi:hypothetical protein
MGLLDKLRRNKEDREYEDFRSAAVGRNDTGLAPQRFDQPPQTGFVPQAQTRYGGPVSPGFQEKMDRMGMARENSRDFEEAARLPDVKRDEVLSETPGYQGIGIQRQEDKMADKFDILQRLDMIEATLSAIRAQTETINERLKTIDMKISQRQPARTGYF